MDAYQQYIHKSRYARYLPEEQRRETWEETIDRYLNFWIEKGRLTLEEANGIFSDIHNLDVMPSMRALMTAGEALDRDNVAGFNCSYLPIDHPKAFDEMMYVLMCGTGVGFSVERQYISKLPEVGRTFMPQIQLYMSLTAKLVGPRLTENLSACSIRAKFQNGTCLEYDLQGQPLKLSEVEQVVQNLLSICLSSPLTSFGKLLDVNLAPSNVTISAVRLHRSSLSGVSVGPLSSVCLILPTIDLDGANQDSGGKIIHNVV